MAVPIVIYKDKVKKHSWARWMVNRTTKKNDNNLVSVIGKTGSGKTWSAISICEIMSKMDGVHFGIEHIVFSLKALMDLINSGSLKKGSKIIFDEPQASISARDFQSDANKVFNLLVTTFRHRNLSLFFCTPFESLLDKNTRKLFHVRIETLSKNLADKTCRLKPRFLEYSDYKNDPYRKQLIVVRRKKKGPSQVDKLFFWDVPKPDKELIDLYEAKKMAFTDQLNKNISARLAKFDQAGKSMTAEQKEEVIERKPLTARQEEVMKVFANSKGFKEASEKIGLSMGNIHKYKKASEKKGYKLEEFKEDV